MYVNLSKKIITKKLLPHLSQTHIGRKTKVPLRRIAKAITYWLESGCQWRELSTRAFSNKAGMPWQSVCYHFRKWSKDGSWKMMWVKLLSIHKSDLDMSSVQLDGFHTPAKRGGEAMAYQGRKKSKTTNALFLTDKNGLSLAMSEPIAGNHNDLFRVDFSFLKMLADLERSQINADGLFLR